MNFGKIDKRLLIPIIFAIALALLQLTPSIAGYFVNTDKVYLGFESIQDSYVYASFIEDAKHNFFLLNKNHALEPQVRTYFVPIFNVAAFMNTWLDLPLVFYVIRFFQTLFFLGCLWYFLSYFYKNYREKLFSYLFIPIAGGFGWLVTIVGVVIPLIGRIRSYDITYWMGFSLIGHMYLFHRYYALGLVLVGFIQLLKYYEKGETKRLIAAALLGLVSFFIHPVTTIFFTVTVIGMQVLIALKNGKIGKKQILTILVFGIVLFPIIPFSAWVAQNPVAADHQKVYFFQKASQPFVFYFIAYGMLLIITLISLTKASWLDDKDSPAIFKEVPKNSLFLSWIITSLILSQIGFGVEYTIFLFVALAFVAAKWIYNIREKVPKLLWIAIILSCILSVPFVIAERTNRAVTSEYAYITHGEDEAMKFLDNQPKGVFLGDKIISSIVVWRTKHTVFSDIEYLTYDYRDKMGEVKQFFDGNLDIPKEYKGKIDYLWIGPAEDLNKTYTSEKTELIFSNSDVKIYKILK
ncbi:MAG: hypothetical protein V1777_05455 [Candidatus Micrarchaeota archaeon]